jgi:hypothetical protein
MQWQPVRRTYLQQTRPKTKCRPKQPLCCLPELQTGSQQHGHEPHDRQCGRDQGKRGRSHGDKAVLVWRLRLQQLAERQPRYHHGLQQCQRPQGFRSEEVRLRLPAVQNERNRQVERDS